MYDELIKRLREGAISADSGNEISESLYSDILQAADAIEGLNVVVRAQKAVLDKFPKWIPVTERLPEESEGLDWHEELMIRFTSVYCYDAKTGTIQMRNRFQGKMTGNEFLDQYTEDADWHWSKSWWEPTHWMPRVPLPAPPKEES